MSSATRGVRGIHALLTEQWHIRILSCDKALDAGRRDGRAREQAVATRALWWDSMPRGIRNNIECRVDAWRRDHPRVSDREAAGRMVDMLLAKLRDHRSGAHRLGVAIRITS